MKTLRATWRLILYLGITAVMYAGWLAVIPVASLSSGGAIRWRTRCFKRWARIVLPVIGVRLTVDGAPPDPPFLLVSNHLGYLDILLFGSRINGRFVAKSDVAAWPVLGPMARSLGTIFIDRMDKRDILRVNGQLEQVLEGNEGIVIFAEGTSTGGDEIRPFRPSLLEFAARTGLPVHAASIWYQTPPGEPHAHHAVCWWGDMQFPTHFFDLLKLSRIEARIVFGQDPVQASDRKKLATELYDEVQTLFTPVIQEENLCLPDPH